MNDGRFIDGRFMFTFGWGVERNTLLKIYDLLSPIETSSAIEKQKNSDGTDVSMLQTIIPVSSIILAESSYAHSHHLQRPQSNLLVRRGLQKCTYIQY